MDKSKLFELCKDLCSDDKEFLIKQFNKDINSKGSNDSLIKRERILFCPYCSCQKIYKNGHTKDNRQKYICSNVSCKKSFSNTSNTILYKTRNSYLKWSRFIQMELQGLTLAEEAKELELSKTTMFSWRHKLYKAVGLFTADQIVKDDVQLDGMFFSINLKGTKPQNMPRYSKKRTSSAYRGISKHKVCVLTAIDSNDNVFMKIAGLGPESIDKMEKIKNNLKCSLLITDAKTAFETYAKNNNIKQEIIKSGTYKNVNNYTLSEVNQIQSEFRTNLTRYRGVSIRHLQAYIDFFCIKKCKWYHKSVGKWQRKNVGQILHFFL